MAKTFYILSYWKDPAEALDEDLVLHVSAEEGLSGATDHHYLHKVTVQTNRIVVDTPRLGDVVDDS